MRLFRLYSLVLLSALLGASAWCAGIIESTTDLTETEFDTLVSENVVAARLVFRAGGANSWELLADNNDGTILPGEVNDSVNWSLNSGNALVASWDFGGEGNLEFTATPSGGSPIVVSTSPTEWFDTILVSVEQHSRNVTDFTFSNNDIDTDVFRDLSALSFNSWDGIIIDLSGYDASNQYPLILSGIMTPVLSRGVVDDQFRGEIFFLQTGVVPEPATLSLTLFGGSLTVGSTSFSDSASVTNTLQTKPCLTSGTWSNLYSVSGVTKTNWTIPVTETQSFFRIRTTY